MELDWETIDNKEICAKYKDLVFRLKFVCEPVKYIDSYGRKYTADLEFLKLQVRKTKNIQFYDIGNNFLLTRTFKSDILKIFTGEKSWEYSETLEIIELVEDILFKLGYID